MNDSQKSSITTTLRVIVTPGCPQCACALGEVRNLASKLPGVSYEVLEVSEMTGTWLRQVHSVPSTIVDDDLVLTGVTPCDRLFTILVRHRELAEHSRELQTLLEGGDFDGALALVTERDCVAALVPIIKRGTTAQRMGVTLIVQALAGCCRERTAGLVEPLLELVPSEKAELRCDVADLLGTIGDDRAIEPLERLCKDLDADVAEIAAFALHMISARSPEMLDEAS